VGRRVAREGGVDHGCILLVSPDGKDVDQVEHPFLRLHKGCDADLALPGGVVLHRDGPLACAGDLLEHLDFSRFPVVGEGGGFSLGRCDGEGHVLG